MKAVRGGAFLEFSLPGGAARTLPPVSYATGHKSTLGEVPKAQPF